MLTNRYRDARFVNIASTPGIALATLPVTDEHDRFLMWRILQDDLACIAMECGVRFIPVSLAIVATEGYLLEGLSAADATHAYAVYGDLVCGLLQQIEAA